MGTFKKMVTIPAKNSASKTLSDLHKEYKEYKMLKKKDQMSGSMPVGTPAYIVEDKWLLKYHKFILFDQFEAEISE